MAERIVKILQFPGSEDTYVINAHALAGVEGQTILKDIKDIKTAIEDIGDVLAFDALKYKGILAEGATLPAASIGDVYKVAFNGTIEGVAVEIGDMLICNTDNTPEGAVANWDVIQGNVDVEAILDHTHEVNIEVTKSAKTLTHSSSLTRANISGEFTATSTSVNGDHDHKATGSVTVTTGGSVKDTEVTPKGTVKITAADTAAENDFSYTPAGTVENTTTITDVTVGSNEVSKHEVTVFSDGAHTPEGSVTVEASVTEGTVEEHKHNVQISAPTANAFNTVVYSGSDMDGVLTFGTASFVTSATVTEQPVAPEFTGVPHSHTASFTGDPVAAHTHTVEVADHDNIVPDITVTSADHSHTFKGTANVFHAEFTGTSETHTHVFEGSEGTYDVDVTVNNYTGDFIGATNGTVDIKVTPDENGTVVTGVSITDHSVDTVDKVSATTEKGTRV